MKNIMISMLICLSATASFTLQAAGDYRPFIEDTKTWTVTHYAQDGSGACGKRVYYFDGDTIVGIMSCKKWMEKEYDAAGQLVGTSLLACVYEEGRKVYFILADGRPHLLYDFEAWAPSWEPGESSRWLRRNVDSQKDETAEGNCVYKGAYEADIRGEKVTCICYQEEDWTLGSTRYQFYIEGIGSTDSPLHCVHNSAPCAEWRLEECSARGKVIYTPDDNPVAAIGMFALEQEMPDELPYQPFVEEGKTWDVCYSVSHGDMPVFRRETYWTAGDTIIGGKTCQRLMCHTEDMGDTSDVTEATAYVYAIFEQDKKVYYIPQGEEQPVLLYDFAARRGDKLQLGSGEEADPVAANNYEVWETMKLQTPQAGYVGLSQARPAMEMRGQLAANLDSRAQQVSEMGLPCPEYTWYEGIGSQWHPFHKSRINPFANGGRLPLLRECRVGDKVIYSNYVDELPSVVSLEAIRDPQPEAVSRAVRLMRNAAGGLDLQVRRGDGSWQTIVN